MFDATPLAPTHIPEGKTHIKCRGCDYRQPVADALARNAWVVARRAPYCPLCATAGLPSKGVSLRWVPERDCYELGAAPELWLTIQAAGWHLDQPYQTWWTKDPAKVAAVAGLFNPNRLPAAMTMALDALDASRRSASAFHVPAPAGMTYRPFQLAGIEYASKRRSTIFGDEPGLGKTIQAIGLVNLKEWSKVLVVCPATLKLNWVRELKRWLLDPLSIGVADSKRWPATDVVVINYDVLFKRSEILEKEWDVVIYDEAHALKNPVAKRTKHGLAIRAKSKLYLTGTPVVNRVIDLWPILHSIDPVKWGSRHDFGVRYCGGKQVRFGKRKAVWIYAGATAPAELQADMREKCLVRRLKRDVLKELPAKQRQVVAFDLPDVAARERAALKPIASLERLDGVAFTEMARVRHESALAKLPLAIEFIRDQLTEDGKIVVFAHHRDVVQGLYIALAEFNPAKVYGGMTPAESQIEVDKFQQSKYCRVFIGNIKAAGTGHTLTAASHVVFVELDWTPAAMEQAADRCHRIGQTDSVLVQYLVVDGTLDANIAQTLEAKQEIADLVLDVKQIVSKTTEV